MTWTWINVPASASWIPELQVWAMVLSWKSFFFFFEGCLLYWNLHWGCTLFVMHIILSAWIREQGAMLVQSWPDLTLSGQWESPEVKMHHFCITSVPHLTEENENYSSGALVSEESVPSHVAPCFWAAHDRQEADALSSLSWCLSWLPIKPFLTLPPTLPRSRPNGDQTALPPQLQAHLQALSHYITSNGDLLPGQQ